MLVFLHSLDNDKGHAREGYPTHGGSTSPPLVIFSLAVRLLLGK